MWTDYQARRMAPAVIPASIAALVLGGICFADDGPERASMASLGIRPSEEPVSYVPTSRTGADSLSPDATARGLRDRLGSTRIVKDVSAVTSGSGISITVELERVTDGLVSSWYAELVAGAYAESVHTHERAYSELVTRAVATGADATGKLSTINLGSGAARLGQKFVSPSDSALVLRTNRVAEQFSLSVADLAVLHPLESALDVTLVVPDGAKVDWTISQLTSALIGDIPDVEGVLIHLVDQSGRSLLRTSSAFRVGAGGLWFAPGQDARFGASHGHGPWG